MWVDKFNMLLDIALISFAGTFITRCIIPGVNYNTEVLWYKALASGGDFNCGH